ncbi:hypothetical protein AB5J62_33645 [Amycolatopsis sp. cg5]|uniref:hypothetical protein n=1 Tax=Amycolatopsis sp. cg5 TaxID=3238802 RepID=UPI00352329DE
MNATTDHNAPTGTWEQEVPGQDGDELWSFSTEYDGRAEDYYAEVAATGGGPYVWTVGECFPGGRELETGKADTPEQAQQQAEQAFARAVNQ